MITWSVTENSLVIRFVFFFLHVFIFFSFTNRKKKHTIYAKFFLCINIHESNLHKTSEKIRSAPERNKTKCKHYKWHWVQSCAFGQTFLKIYFHVWRVYVASQPASHPHCFVSNKFDAVKFDLYGSVFEIKKCSFSNGFLA